jgi:hypothetical protein
VLVSLEDLVFFVSCSGVSCKVFVCRLSMFFVIGTSLGYVEGYWQVVQTDVLGCEYVEESRKNRHRMREVYVRGAMRLILDRPSASRQA